MKVCKCLATSSVKFYFSCSVRLYQPYVFFSDKLRATQTFLCELSVEEAKIHVNKMDF